MPEFQVMDGGAQPPTQSANRTLMILVVVCAIIAVIAIIIAAVAVSRPAASNITVQPGQSSSTSGTASAATGTASGTGSSGAASSVTTSTGGKIYTIHIGHDFGAHEYIDSSGYLAGFYHDLIDAVCTEAGMDCRTVWDKYSNCWDSTPGQPSHGGQGLLGNWYDACSGWYTTIDRIQVFKFAQPFLKAPMSNFFVIKGQGSSFPSRNVNNKKIGFVDGWASDEKCLARWTDVQNQNGMTVIHGSTPTELVDKMQRGEIDAIFATISDMEPHTTGSNPVAEVVNSGSFSCMIAGSAMMAPKDGDFTDKWNVGFNKLTSSGKFRKLCIEGQNKHGSRGQVDCVDG